MFGSYRKAVGTIGLVFCLFSSVFAYSGGSGEPNNPYQIATVADWNDLMNTSSDWNKNFILTADVNLRGVALTPISNFTGVFDGNNHIICNAIINRPTTDSVGLFGFLNNLGQIRNLGVEDVNMTGHDFVGGLVGLSFGTLTACRATGSVTGGEYSSIGGLMRSNSGTVTDCFWDIETSGQQASVGGKPKTTAEMQKASTFLEAGWDFVDEVENGTEDIWWILEGQGYPRLWWETE